MVRFVHTADWQVGMTRHFLTGEAQARFAAARTEAIVAVGRLAEREGAEFVLVCGDVFETNQLSRQTVGRALEALGQVPVPVYLLPGNHDPLDALTVYRSPAFREECPDHVHVLDGAEPVVTVREGVELVSAPWRGKHPGRDLVAESLAAVGSMPSAGTVRIVAGHGAVDLLDPKRRNPAAIALAPLEQALSRREIHYVALGDRHSVTSVGSTGAVWYAGAPEVTSHREDRPGEALVVDVDPDGTVAVQPHHVGTWRFTELSRELAGADDVEALAAELAAVPDKSRTVLRLTVHGELTVAERARLDELLQQHGEVFGALRCTQEALGLTAGGASTEALALAGFLAAAAAEISTLASGGGTAGSGPATGQREESDHDMEPAETVPTPADEALLDWQFHDAAAPDAHSAADALALLHRLSREAAG